MQQTTNFQLPSWEASDRILRTDFNDMTEKLDAALGEHAAALATAGNCQIYTTSYVGTGACGKEYPTTLTLPVAPLLAVIVQQSSDGVSGGACGLMPGKGAMITMQGACTSTWTADGKTVSWYSTLGVPAAQLNMQGVTYQVYIFAPAE